MTDNRTTELREKLTERGVDYEVKDLPDIKFFHDTRWNSNGVRWCYTEFVGGMANLTMCNEWKDCTPEQALAVTLVGEWDGKPFVEYAEHVAMELRNEAWALLEGCDEAATLGNSSDAAATLGSDNEYEAKMDALLCRLTNGKWSKTRQYSLEFMVSCVDEEYEDVYEKERAELGSETCECVAEYAESPIDGKTIVLHRCSACHELMRPFMHYCPNCGKRIRKAVER